jgi:hypothetical protein
VSLIRRSNYVKGTLAGNGLKRLKLGAINLLVEEKIDEFKDRSLI